MRFGKGPLMFRHPNLKKIIKCVEQNIVPFKQILLFLKPQTTEQIPGVINQLNHVEFKTY